MPKADSELLVINKTYDFMIWLDQRIDHFPRRRQRTVGDRLDRRVNDVLEGLLKAKYTSDRAGILRDVNFQLEVLRFQLRSASRSGDRATTQLCYLAAPWWPWPDTSRLGRKIKAKD